jgi:hypothetical protein
LLGVTVEAVDEDNTAKCALANISKITTPSSVQTYSTWAGFSGELQSSLRPNSLIFRVVAMRALKAVS